MTAALMCDNCGRIASTRNEESENHAAEGWFLVDRNPVISGPGFHDSGDDILSRAAEIMQDDDLDDDEQSELLSVLFEPTLHFCTSKCLKAWAERQGDGDDDG